MTDLERARAIFEQQGTFAEGLVGCRIDAVADGYALCSLELQQRHLNGLGSAMGGVIFTLADYAYAVASNFDRDVFVTSASNIRFLKAAHGGRITAEAREIRSGRRSCLFEVAVRDENGELLALAEVAGTLTVERTKKTQSAESIG